MTRSETLFDIYCLAVFLWALERNAEALAVARSITTAIPEPPPIPGRGINYSLWWPAVSAHALVARLAGPALREQADLSRAAIRKDCGLARNNPDYLDECFDESRVTATAPAGHTTLKWECLGLARALKFLVTFSELANAGDPLFKKYAKETAVLAPQALAKLGALLHGAA